MNVGVQNVHNLAWKLAGHPSGWAGIGLLDTHESECRTRGTRRNRRGAEVNTTRTTRVDATRFGPWGIVTGSSSGIGKQFVRQLASSQLNLVLVARRLDALESLGKELSHEFGIEYRAVGLDLSDEMCIRRHARFDQGPTAGRDHGGLMDHRPQSSTNSASAFATWTGFPGHRNEKGGFMQITVFGASGGIGQHFVRFATERGHSIRAVYRAAPAVPPRHVISATKTR